jgi:hypothetical protein
MILEIRLRICWLLLDLAELEGFEWIGLWYRGVSVGKWMEMGAWIFGEMYDTSGGLCIISVPGRFNTQLS